MKQQSLRFLMLCLAAFFALGGCVSTPNSPASSAPLTSSPESASASSFVSDASSSFYSDDSSVFSVVPAVSSAASSAVPSVYVSSAASAAASSKQQTGTPSVPQTRSSLTGKITGLTDTVVTVTDNAGNSYRFKRGAIQPDKNSGTVQPGAAITLVYSGSLARTGQLQQVQVISCSIPKTEQKPVQPTTAQSLLDAMTLSQKVAQLFIVRCPAQNAAESVSQYQFGGYVLFGNDFKGRTKAQVSANIQSYQSASKIPMLIAVDEEGGKVNRISLYPAFRAAPFLSPRELYTQGGWPLIQSDTAEKCVLLRSLGINLNLAPVCDVSTDPQDYIYPRTFGGSAAETAQYISTVVTVMQKNGLGCTLKHFPGYGSNVDTHTGIARDERSLEHFRQNDFLPFQSGITAGAPVVMVSHNIVTAMDAEHPASLSPAVHRLLRQELGFRGLIMTDELDMGGIKQYTGGQDPAVAAVLAGNDLLCCTNYASQHAAVLKAVQSGTITEARIDESVRRILQYKIDAGILKK